MKKRIFSLFLALVMALCLVPSANTYAAKRTKKAALKAYYAYLKSGKPQTYRDKKYNKFTLMDLDNDKIPELVAQYKDREGTFVDYYVILAYDGSTVQTLDVSEGVAGAGGFRGNLSYMPKKGLIYNLTWSSGTGSQYNTLYSLKNGKFTTKVKMVNERDMKTYKLNYTWNGKKTTEKKQNAKFNKLYNTKKAKTFDKLKYISRKKMLSKLK
ncbi:MAG: hypothetical protein IKQ71_07450 [Lachnospiraceae bacterium]|nr:hypothetical protein [Lachnospiraceae bacterium]